MKYYFKEFRLGEPRGPGNLEICPFTYKEKIKTYSNWLNVWIFFFFVLL